MKRKLLPLMFIILLSNISFAAETIIEIIPVYNRPASEIQPLINPMLENTDRVIADGSNLIVKTTPDRLNAIKKFIWTGLRITGIFLLKVNILRFETLSIGQVLSPSLCINLGTVTK